MSFNTATRPIPISVFGAAYLPENHSDWTGPFSDRSEVEQLRASVTCLWVALFAMIGISLVTGQVGKALHIAGAALH